MKIFKKKIQFGLFVMYAIIFLACNTGYETMHNLAPQSLFINGEISEPLRFIDRYLIDIENLRDNLAKGNEKQVKQILDSLPEGYGAYRFNSAEEIRQLLVSVIDIFDYSRGSEVDHSVFFDNYVQWLNSVFPGIFKIVQNNSMDFSTESLFQIITLLTENAFQHGQGQCILIIGSTETQHCFSIISKGEFKNVKGAFIARGQAGAVRGKNTGNGVALSETLEWYLSELNDFIVSYYSKDKLYDYDVLVSGRDGKYSYKGFLSDKGYTSHNNDKGGAAATFFLGETEISALQDFLSMIFQTDDLFETAA